MHDPKGLHYEAWYCSRVPITVGMVDMSIKKIGESHMLVRSINQLSSHVKIKENSLSCDILFMQWNEIVFITSVCVCAHIYFHVFHCSPYFTL